MYDNILKLFKNINSVLIYVLMFESIIALILFIYNQYNSNGLF